MLPPADINNSEPWRLTLKRSFTPITYYLLVYYLTSFIKIVMIDIHKLNTYVCHIILCFGCLNTHFVALYF